ncbi:MAG: vitamin K epoxide reductase/DsbA family protein [Pseudobdellovibrio sp.]
MNKKINILLISILLAIASFTYLAIHHYALKAGLGGESICSISSTINCDAAATSSYAEVFHIPIAVLGGVFYIILFSFVLFYKLEWIETSSYLRNILRAQLVAAALVSVIMAGISFLIVKVACPFCFATYIFSFINLFVGWNLVPATRDKFDISNYFGEYKSHLIALACVPVFSWAVAGMVANSYGFDEIEKYVPEKIAIWKAGTEYSFDNTIGISNKVESPKYTLIEFADFKCPHCKVASGVMSAFLRGRSDVRFIYKPYPLDGSCNTAISQKGDGSRCGFAALALCSDKLAGKGMDVMHWLFDNQESFYEIADAKKLAPQIQEKFGIDSKSLSDCADSTETYDIINKSAQEGNKANVEGTPTIYLNGKKLPWGQMIEVLRAAAE